MQMFWRGRSLAESDGDVEIGEYRTEDTGESETEDK